MRVSPVATTILGLLLGLPCTGIANAATPDEVVVIVNRTSPVSVRVGENYAHKRNVANVLRVSCIDSSLNQNNETIDYTDYLSEIETPLRAFLASHPGVNFVVTTRGVPIRVAGGETGEAYSGTTLTSLDSTIAAIDYDKDPQAVLITFNDPSGGAVGTAWLNKFWDQHAKFTHAQFGGYLVTRLDGYSESDALALTDHALKSEAGLKQGKILFDIEPDFGIASPGSQPAPIPNTLITQENPYSDWNGDMKHAAIKLRARGIPFELDKTQTFVGNRRDLLGYFSWGSNDDHFSQAAYNSLSFAPGAVGDTAISTSARSFFPQSSGQSMIADLIAQGITGVKGYTDEPLLQAIASPTILTDRFTRGYSLAESFYAASHFVGWTDIVVGDPLTTPYK